MRFSTSWPVETIRFVRGCAEDLRSKLTTHPLLGPVNYHEVLILMVVHPERHAKQIDEARAAGRRLHI